MKLDALGDGGVNRDQAGFELGPNVWTDALNVRMYQGWATSFDGSSRIISPSSTAYWLSPYYTATARYLVYAGTAKIYRHDGTTETDITPTPAPTGAASDKWTGGVLTGILIVNNGKDGPWYYSGTGTAAALTAWPASTTCKALRPFKNFLVALNVTKSGTNYPFMVKWSHEADPGSIPASWDTTNPAYDAGEQDLAETPDKVIDCLPLGDINVIYKERSAYGMQYIGPPYIWRFFRLPGELGMLTQNCAAVTPLGHVVLAQGDVYLHNGGEPKSIIDQRMRNWLFASIDPDNYAACFVTMNPRKQEVWICFPEVGRTVCTKALVWSWANDTLSVRELQNYTAGTVGVLTYLGDTWNSDSSSWSSDVTTWNDGADFNLNDSRMFMASTDAANGIQGVDTGSAFNGLAISSYVEKTGMHFDSPDAIKLVRRVWPKIDASAGTQITVQIGASMDAMTAPTYATPVTFTVGTDQHVDTFVSGRYLAIKMSATSRWRTRSLDLDVVPQGKF